MRAGQSRHSTARPLHDRTGFLLLQEYFVPKEKFKKWVTAAKPIYAQIEASQLIALLNTTVRFVHYDADMVQLAYAQAPQGMFAFVLYYRLSRTKAADEELGKMHHALVEITLELGGTFYLPYRHHYSSEQMDRAYPNAKKFFEKKQQYDQ